MKLTWKNSSRKKRPLSSVSLSSNLPFDRDDDDSSSTTAAGDPPIATELDPNRPQNDTAPRKTLTSDKSKEDDETALADSFQAQGDKFAEDGRYREALGKWEAALNLKPERAVLHEQKAQVLLEIGEAWKALKAATRATELEPLWAEAWITLGRAQLNFGEPDGAMESFDRALAIKPDLIEAKNDRQEALHLVKKRKQLHSSDSSSVESRYVVGDKEERP